VVVRALVVAAVVAGTVGFMGADKSITVSVDGDSQQVKTFASTVAGVLADEQVVVGEHDVVIPSTTSVVSDGAQIEVLRGRPVSLTIDGVTRQVWTTAQTVDELAASLGSRYAAATHTASRSQRLPLTGFALELTTPKTVTIRHDGTTRRVVTTAATVADALSEVGVAVRTADLVSTDLARPVVEGMTLTVVRVTTKTSTKKRSVDFRTIRKADGSMYKGTTRVARSGHVGRQKVTYVSTYHDGKLFKKKRVSVKTARKPVAQVVHYGTKNRPTSNPPVGGSVDQLNWPALARCESSGNPRSVGGGGRYFGLYQFTLGTWASVGGSGNPINASATEQTYRAKLLYRSRGAQPWPVCGRMLFT
jgi:uncharacterized protein YabE (DUF348 family)